MVFHIAAGYNQSGTRKINEAPGDWSPNLDTGQTTCSLKGYLEYFITQSHVVGKHIHASGEHLHSTQAEI